MKKALAFILVLCILCSIPVSAMAAQAERKEYLWSDMKDAVKESGVSGRFVTFDEVDLTFWLPDIYEDVLEKEDKDEGYIGIFMTEDGEGYVDVTYEESEWDTLEELRDDLIAEEIDGVELVTANGLDAVEYLLSDEEEDPSYFWCLSFLTDGGNLVTFSIYPVTEDEDIQFLTFAVLSSIQSEEALEKAA